MTKPHFSPSQFNEAARCLRRWHYSTVQGRRQPETDAMRRGTRIHRLLEVYVSDPEHPLPTAQSTVTYTEQLPIPLIEPDGSIVDKREVTIPCDPKEQRHAQSGLLLIPDPTQEHLVAEGEFLLPAEVTGLGKPVKGFIDLWIPGTNTLVDYKTRSSDRYDKDEEELRHDPQCILYAAEKMRHIQPDPDGKRRLSFRHINIYTDGKRARPVQLDNITEDEVEQGLQRLRPLAQRMLIAETLPVTEVPVNVQACGDYRGCPFRVECGANGLPVFGDNWQARSAKQMAMAQGTYRSPEELEEKMAGFAKALLDNKNIIAVNPPDGTPASVVGSVETHKAVEAAVVEARSELDEEGQGEAPSEAVVAETSPTIGRQSARDKNVQSILDSAKLIDSAERLEAFHQALGHKPESTEALKALLTKMSGPSLKQLLSTLTAMFATGTAAPAPAPSTAPSTDGLTLPKSLAEFDAFVQTVEKLITSGEVSVAAITTEISSWSAKRNAAEESDDIEAAEACTARITQLRRTLKENKDVIADLRTKYSADELDKIKVSLTPKPEPKPEPVPVVEQPPVVQPAPVASGTTKPALLIRGQLIAQDASVLHIETIISKYQAAVAAAAGVESVHDIKYEGSARVAALLAKDIHNGLIDVRKYAAISVPRRGAAWDPVIDVLRPFVGHIFEGVG